MGAEAELAIHYEPPPGGRHPGNLVIFQALRADVLRRVHGVAARGLIGSLQERVFLSNGGAIHYEALPEAMDGGLVELATPECRRPIDVLVRLRAMESLLSSAASAVERQLGGTLLLRRNGCDPEGRVYGPQESYEVTLASGIWLGLWRVGLAVLLPLSLVSALVGWVALLGLIAGALGWMVVTLLSGRGLEGWSVDMGRAEQRVTAVVWGPVVAACALLIRLTAFRPQRAALEGFLVTRMLWSGAGRLTPEGDFVLSEKAHAIQRDMRWTVSAHDRGLWEIGHLLKGLVAPALFDLRRFFKLWRGHQRLQLGMSDATCCDVSTWLRFGVTGLLLDAAEAGALDGVPRPRSVATAAQAVSMGACGAAVVCTDGRVREALHIQRIYYDRAVAWVADQPTVDLEQQAVLRAWGAILDALGTDERALIGRVDWVTKRELLDAASADPYAVRKRVDLSWHDLPVGGFHALDAAGLMVRVADPADVAVACAKPPEDTPARWRGEVIREAATDGSVQVDWDTVRHKGRVIDLSAWRGRRGG